MKNEITSQLMSYSQSYKELDEIYCDYAKDCGLSDTAFWILYSVWESIEAFTQKELCDTWFFSRQTINSSLKKLEQQDIIQLVPMPNNRKNKHIILTQAGKELAKKILVPIQEADYTSFSSLSDAERSELLRLSQKYISALRKEITAKKANAQYDE